MTDAIIRYYQDYFTIYFIGSITVVIILIFMAY